MLMGKAVLRAVRGHMIVDCVLRILIISNILGLNLQETDTEDKENNDQIDETKTQMEDVDAPMKAKFDRLWQLAFWVKNSRRYSGTCRICRNRTHYQGRKEKTKVYYFKALDKVYGHDKCNEYTCTCIYQDRENWQRQMHLFAVKEMLPYFAATGHNIYIMSAYTYLQQMQTLEVNHTDIYLKFCEGYHVVRRSSKYWEGLPTDLREECREERKRLN